MKIGILKEYKTPADNRVVLSPKHCAEIQKKYPSISFLVEPSSHRCYKDEAYTELGIELNSDLSDCDVIIGVKEVPKERLLADKTYFFFSHTIKAQDYNLDLMKKILSQRIRMIDHETLVQDDGQRIIGFGRWAGIVGAHYALLMMGRKSGNFELKTANECDNLAEMLGQYDGIQWPAMKIALTGDGRVGKGALEVLQKAGILEVSVNDFKSKTYDHAVFCVLKTTDIYRNADGTPIDPSSFYNDPGSVVNAFSDFYECTDVLIHGIYWDFRAPALFTKEEAGSDTFSINLISDITCDVEGSIPFTYEQTSIEKPYISVNPKNGNITEGFSKESMDIMAVGNLPNELPKDASDNFAEVFSEIIIPELLKPESKLLDNATICKNGRLTEKFSYLEEWVNS